tara:strand:- start:5867 stop:5986 length:120 start_codon:yes stop_codon:yes gene_type:complete
MYLVFRRIVNEKVNIATLLLHEELWQIYGRVTRRLFMIK